MVLAKLAFDIHFIRSPLIPSKKRSPPLLSKSDRLSTNQQHQTAIAPNLNQTAIASIIPTFTTQAIAPQQANNIKTAITSNLNQKQNFFYD
ncbi:hypothetical protein B9G53_22680 [Pseudanabaena sp. SR411]|uniref:hypothetical protein n=1 Tax=Pseudanabaena sp. SR411 TaxID=1980935 RepID=UPI000B98FED1|nr:hypothetical protein [Pseudanabaena sp. SR411]OYQ62335.1 hypothetical protein B9G53_22680 [Pseudanabaena sp. SR411]